VADYYVADLQAAMALSANDAKAALADLAAAAPYDDVSLTPYLRGLAHLASGEARLAVADFQMIVDHRGAAFIGGSNVYPMAQIGLARAYGALGDQANSKVAYRRFAALWRAGDQGQALLSEALAKGR
jgi:serine/threonine-protein kinase